MQKESFREEIRENTLLSVDDAGGQGFQDQGAVQTDWFCETFFCRAGITSGLKLRTGDVFEKLLKEMHHDMTVVTLAGKG